MSTLYGKMKMLKKDLKNFNHSHFGGLLAKVVEKRKELAAFQTLVLSSSSNFDLIELEQSLSLELNDLLIAKESFLSI